MRFHVLLTVALLLTSLMSIEAKPVNGAEMERDSAIESCFVSCTYCAYNCGTPSSVD
uniref:Turripeptide XIV-01 n=1 Tax=Gemmula speciosa TaxID=439592 RepID=TUE1_GEMSP|nr:RecName: Full=Turripeptide XIV-01; Flags: Precursor [Gemmula speciosa]ADE28869.1 putative turritoxin XIV-01 precursor [Gemmula speciosa]